MKVTQEQCEREIVELNRQVEFYTKQYNVLHKEKRKLEEALRTHNLI